MPSPETREYGSFPAGKKPNFPQSAGLASLRHPLRMLRFKRMALIHINLDTLVADLERRGFAREIAERARAALAAPDQDARTN